MISLVAATLLALSQSQDATQSGLKVGEWNRIFNGKNLDGWRPKIKGYGYGENFGNTFRVVDGVLRVAYDEYDEFNGRFGHLFYRHSFSSYRLRLEYRFLGDQVKGGPGWAWRNSGIMIHGQTPESMGKDQDFPVSAEVQMLGGPESGHRPTGNLCTPGTHVVMDGKLITQHVIDSSSPTFRGDGWVALEVRVEGSRKFEHFVNGKLVLTYGDLQYDVNDATAKPLMKSPVQKIERGTISLQSESHPVEFRNIEIMPLEN